MSRPFVSSVNRRHDARIPPPGFLRADPARGYSMRAGTPACLSGLVLALVPAQRQATLFPHRPSRRRKHARKLI